MSNFKKLFIASITAITVLGVMGVVPSAKAAVDGDLIKMAGNSAVYYLKGGKRYVFPQQNVYMSWYKDFSGVQTIPASELQSYPIGGNVTMRPGTWMVKITTDPKVYAVEPGGSLRHVSTEAVALALYGAQWNKKIVDVSDAFFVNYTSGTAISTNVHPTGSVVQVGSQWYYVDNGSKRPFASEAAIAANNIDTARFGIVTTLTYTDGSSITGMESAISNVAGGASSTPTSAAGLTVSGGAMTASTSLPKGANSVKVGSWNFAAGPEGAVTLSSVTFKRTGVGNVTDISNVYVYDGVNRLTSGRTFNSSTNEAAFTINMAIPAGSTKMLSLYVSISATAAAGNQHVFTVESASKVSSNAASVNGVFPIASNMHSIAGASAGSITLDKTGSPSNPRVGDTGAKVSEFKLSAGSAEDVWVSQVTLTQGGTVSNSALSNFMLKQNGVTVATAASIASNDRLDLVFSPTYKIEKGNNRTFELYGDIAGRPADTVKFYIEDNADLQAVGGTFGVGVTASIATTDTPAASTPMNSAATAHSLLLQGGQFTITFDGPSSANISNSASDIVIWKGAVYSVNAVEIRNWRVKIEDTATGTDIDLVNDANSDNKADAGETLYVQDIKLWNLDNNTVIAGPVELAQAGVALSAYTQQLTMTEDYSMTAGQTMHVGISVDIKNTPAAGITLKATLGDGTNSFTANDIKNSGSNTYLDLATDIVPSSTIPGQSQTVTAAGLTVTTAPSPTDSISIKGVSGYNATSFNFAAGSGSSVKVNSVTITAGTNPLNANVYGALGAGLLDTGETSASVSSLILSAKLMDGSTQVGQSKSFSSGTATFDNLNWVIPGSQTKKLDLVVSTNSAATLSATSDFVRFSVEASGVSAVDSNGNTVSGNYGLPVNSADAVGDVVMTVKGTGSLTAALAPTPSNPTAQLIASGSTDKVLAAYKFDAIDESFNIKKFQLISSSATNNARIATLKVRYPKQSGGTEVRSVGLSGANNNIDISDTPMYVAQNGSGLLEVIGDAALFSNLDGTEGNVTLGFTLKGDDATNNQATGIASNSDVTNFGSNSVGNAHLFLRTVLTVAAGSGTPNNTARTRSATQKVASYNLTASSTSNGFFRGSKKAADSLATLWVANGMAAAATNATAVSGSSSIALTEAAASAANDSTNYDFGASAGLTAYNKLGFWIRSTDAKAVGDMGISVSSTADATDNGTLDGLGTVSVNNVNLATAITNANQWYYQELTVTTAATDRYVTFNIKANVANDAVTLIDDLRFYRDSLNVDISGNLHGTIATSAGVLFSLKDSGGATRMYGAYQGGGSPTGASTTVGTVMLVAGNGADVAATTTYSDVEISSSVLALDLETNTSSLMAVDASGVAESLSVSIDTGNVSSAGDFVWYDNSDSAGGNNMAGLTVASPVSTTITFANTY